MKLNLHFKHILFLLSILMIFSFTTDPVKKKIIRTKKFDIYFYISLKEKKTSNDKKYFWFKSGEIHESYGDAGGRLLHLKYVKYFADKQLAEKGTFNYGLKEGLWKIWHNNGVIKETIKYRNGERSGPYNLYSNSGKLLTSGKYKDNQKNGVWVNYPVSDTIWYKNGKAFLENPKIIQKRLDSINKRNDSINGKKSFFRRIIPKRDNTKNKESFLKRLLNRFSKSNKKV